MLTSDLTNWWNDACQSFCTIVKKGDLKRNVPCMAQICMAMSIWQKMLKRIKTM